MTLPIDSLIKKATTSTTTLSALIPKLWAAQIETNLRLHECLQQSVVVNEDLLVPGAGDTVYIPSLPDMAMADSLTEGTDMSIYALNNASSVPYVPTEYGKVVEITRKALDRIKYDGMAAIMDRLSYSMALRIESSLFQLFNASVPGTSNKMSQVYANGKTSANITSADVFNDTLILQAKQALQDQLNEPFADGYFRMYISPKQFTALIQDTNIRNDLRYASPQALLNGEVGVLHGVRIVVTPYISNTSILTNNNITTENTVSVHNGLMLAPRWAAIAWKRRAEAYVDPTLYDGGRRRRFGVTSDYDAELLHAERGVVIKSA